MFCQTIGATNFNISIIVKQYFLSLTFLGSIIIFISCSDKKQDSQTETTSAVDASVKSTSIENYSSIFKNIIKSDVGMARGVSIGDGIETIQETILPSESQPDNGKGFTVYFDDTDLNFADIVYVQDIENKVGAISIDIFIEKKSEVDSLMSELTDYFDKKYGKGKGISKMMTWQMPDGNNLMLQDVSTGKDPGLKIVFAKSGDKLLQ